MRRKLAEIEGERAVFTGVFIRTGVKDSYKGTVNKTKKNRTTRRLAKTASILRFMVKKCEEKKKPSGRAAFYFT